MPFHNPVSPETVDTVVGMLSLRPGDRALDVGCGRGELLLRLVERLGVSGLGVDSAEGQIATARAEASARVPEADLRFEVLDASQVAEPDGSFALAACVGSTHALGGLDGTLRRLAALVRPGGLVPVGEGFGALQPSAAYPEVVSK